MAFYGSGLWVMPKGNNKEKKHDHLYNSFHHKTGESEAGISSFLNFSLSRLGPFVLKTPCLGSTSDTFQKMEQFREAAPRDSRYR